MHLTPREIDKLMIFTAGEVARKRRAARDVARRNKARPAAADLKGEHLR